MQNFSTFHKLTASNKTTLFPYHNLFASNEFDFLQIYALLAKRPLVFSCNHFYLPTTVISGLMLIWKRITVQSLYLQLTFMCNVLFCKLKNGSDQFHTVIRMLWIWRILTETLSGFYIAVSNGMHLYIAMDNFINLNGLKVFRSHFKTWSFDKISSNTSIPKICICFNACRQNQSICIFDTVQPVVTKPSYLSGNPSDSWEMYMCFLLELMLVVSKWMNRT